MFRVKVRDKDRVSVEMLLGFASSVQWMVVVVGGGGGGYGWNCFQNPTSLLE